MNITCKAVELMVTLLKAQPLSQQPTPEVSSAPPAQNQTPPMHNDSPASSTVPGMAPQTQATSPLSARWPTPKPSQWLDIELVATRACTTLGWALSPAVVCQVPAEALDSLAVQLYQLIQRLVIGHLPGLELSVRKLFRLGLQPILAFHSRGYAETTGPVAAMLSRLAVDSSASLAVAMLSRLARDSSVIPVGCTHAAEICNIFCKSGSSMTLVCRALLAAHCLQTKYLTDGGRCAITEC